MAHCAEYGFILRYPTDKSILTGVNYEPWHYRYAGTDAAKEIMADGLCLEEYLLDRLPGMAGGPPVSARVLYRSPRHLAISA